MTTTFPGTLDSYSTTGSGTTLVGPMVNNLAAAMDAVEANIGVNAHLPYASIAARLAALQYATFNTVTANYTLVLADDGKVVTANSGSALTITVPPQSSVAWVAGTFVYLRTIGVGTVTIAGGTGVTLRSRGSVFTLNGQYAWAFICRVASDIWELTGDIA